MYLCQVYVREHGVHVFHGVNDQKRSCTVSQVPLTLLLW